MERSAVISSLFVFCQGQHFFEATFFLAVAILDKTINELCSRSQCAASTLLAIKLNEIDYDDRSLFRFFNVQPFHVFAEEINILEKLNWNIIVPTIWTSFHDDKHFSYDTAVAIAIKYHSSEIEQWNQCVLGRSSRKRGTTAIGC